MNKLLILTMALSLMSCGDGIQHGPLINGGVSEEQLVSFLKDIKGYDKAIKDNPKDAEAYFERGTIKRAIGKYKEAIKDFDEAIKLKPDYALAYFNRGNAKGNLGLFKEADKDFTKAHELEPDKYPAVKKN